MNKQDCKKYLKKAYKNIRKNNKKLTITNIEIEIKKILEEQNKEYIAFSKIAIYNMIHSGNVEITLKDLVRQIEILPNLYSKEFAIKLANDI